MPDLLDKVARGALQKVIGDSYEIKDLIGRGGMGAVYLAREKALRRRVAIKVLRPELAVSEELRERFRREARTAAQLAHPNIVALHSFGETDEIMYFVMQYVEGESLSALMRRKGPISPEETRPILAELAHALHHAHEAGVIHRDIKPENIVLEAASGRPMLMDFGVAKASSAGQTLTTSGRIFGTPHFMSPEQASGSRDLDGRSDLYALGVVGYTLISGKLPFQGATAQEVFAEHFIHVPRSLQSLVSTVPEDLAFAIGRCLEKSPSERWPDAGSFAKAIENRKQQPTPHLKRSWFDGMLFTWLAPLSLLAGLIVTSLNVWTSTGAADAALAGAPLCGGDSCCLNDVWYTAPGRELSHLFSSFRTAPRSLNCGREFLSMTYANAFVFFVVSFICIALPAAIRRSRSPARPPLATHLFRQPRWLYGWFPTALRHPGTTGHWVRTPHALRTMQTIYDIVGVTLIGLGLPALLAMLVVPGDITNYPLYNWASRVRLPAFVTDPSILTMPFLLLAFVVVTALSLRRRGLTWTQVVLFSNGTAFAPKSRSVQLFRDSRVIKLMQPQTHGDPRPTGQQTWQTPQSHHAHIVSLLSTIGGDMSSVAAPLTAASRRLVREIERLDSTIQSLAKPQGSMSPKNRFDDSQVFEGGSVTGLFQQTTERRRVLGDLLAQLANKVQALTVTSQDTKQYQLMVNELREVIASIDRTVANSDSHA